MPSLHYTRWLTGWRSPSPPPCVSRSVMGAQVVPDRDSIRTPVRVPELPEPVYDPTAWHELDVSHETAARAAPLATGDPAAR